MNQSVEWPNGQPEIPPNKVYVDGEWKDLPSAVEKAAKEFAENKCKDIKDETVRKLSIIIAKNDFAAGYLAGSEAKGDDGEQEKLWREIDSLSHIHDSLDSFMIEAKSKYHITPKTKQ